MKRYFLAILIVFTFSNCEAQQSNDVYYKVITMRATPGKLLDLIDVIKIDLKNFDRAGIEKPFLMRHSQGDQWDLLLIYPIKGLRQTLFRRRTNQKKGEFSYAGSGIWKTVLQFSIVARRINRGRTITERIQ